MDAFPGLPEWAQAWVAEQVAILNGSHLNPEQAEIVRRLTTDARMRYVWKELSCRKRNGEFVHPATQVLGMPPMLYATPEDIQAAMIAQVLLLTFRVVVHPKYFAVKKPQDIAKARRKLLSEAAKRRRIAATTVYHDIVNGLLQEAASLQEAAASLCPGDDDPFVIQRDRGDRVEKGVQTRISQLLMERFGNRLDRTTATLTAVALGLDHRSERVGRSALSRPKRAR
jgi:hypothetical protein